MGFERGERGWRGGGGLSLGTEEKRTAETLAARSVWSLNIWKVSIKYNFVAQGF